MPTVSPLAADLTVVVLSWNTRDLTLAALAAVDGAAAPLVAKTICVDNASADGSAAAVRARFPGVQVIENAENLGFARGNDVALPYVEGRVVVFLNSDTEAAPGSLAHVVRFLDAHPEVGIASPGLLHADGRPQRTAWPIPTVPMLLHQYTPLGWLGVGASAARRLRPPRDAKQEAGKVEAVAGACLAIRRDLCARLGGFDPDYRFYVEDVDLCWRAAKEGFATHLVTDGPPVLHHGGQSAAIAGTALRLPLLRGMLRLTRKRLSPARAAFFEPAFKLGVLARAALEALRAPLWAVLRRLRGRAERARRTIDTARDRIAFLERDVAAFLRS